MRQLFIAIAFLLLCNQANAQSGWTLQRCVQYAVDHNISIQQNELNSRLAALSLQQSQLSQIPSVSANAGYGRSFGRSVDPTTNQFADNSYDFFSLGGNVDVLLFGWFQKRKINQLNKFTLEATKSDLDQLKDDVSLNVATGFLRALLAQEQIKVNEKQVDLSKEQLNQTRKFVAAGRLPELNTAQLESQLASDSANLINAISVYNSSVLDLKALLNLDFAVPFNIQPPIMDMAKLIDISKFNPAQIYTESARQFGSIRSSVLKLAASQKKVEAMQSALYPSIGISGQFGTNYASSYSEVTDVEVIGSTPTGTFAQGPNNNIYPVYQPAYHYRTRTIPFGSQFGDNFRYSVSLGLSIPIFNSWQSQYALKQSKINLLSDQLNKYQTEITLEQNVYKAYNDAVSAVQKFNAADRAATAAQRAFDFAQKRYDLGLTNTVEYLTTQNNQFVAESNLTGAKYDLIFKLKVIDYYLGKELKL